MVEVLLYHTRITLTWQLLLPASLKLSLKMLTLGIRDFITTYHEKPKQRLCGDALVYNPD